MTPRNYVRCSLGLLTISWTTSFCHVSVLPVPSHASGIQPSPVKASAKRTPQPSPAYGSAIERAQEGSSFPESLNRVSALRGACLVRDRHRCVVSRKFDWHEAANRVRKQGNDALDDDGNLLREDDHPVGTLEVAHILPHFIMATNPGSKLVCFPRQL